MSKRKAAEPDVAESQIPSGDSWALRVESCFWHKAPVLRGAVLRWLAAVFLVRRWVSMSRLDRPRAERYLRLPQFLLSLANLEFPGQFLYRGSCGRTAPKATRVRDILQVMKINDEPYDHCSRVLGDVLTGQTVEQAEMKAYVIARTYSRLAVESSVLREQWTDIHHGVDLLLKDVMAKDFQPRDIFTQSFGPNCRHFNTCVGSLPAQMRYVRDLFPSTLPPLEWKDEAGQHASKEEIFMQLLSWPGVGCLTGKNIFQIVRRCTAFRQFRAAAGNARHDASQRCAFSGPGSRTAINLLFAEPGGRGFLRDNNSAAALRHFHPKVMFLQRAFTKEVRSLVDHLGTPAGPLWESFRSEDETCFIFTLCETSKVLCYLATGNSRYELDLF